jgi:hypothetical protein
MANPPHLLGVHGCRLCQIAEQLGLSEGEFRQQCWVSSGKLAEFRHRGLVSIHVIVRLDRTRGPATPSPKALTVEVLTETVRRAGPRAVVNTPNSRAAGAIRQIYWGEQLDIRPITADAADEEELTDQKVAWCAAKYATKAAEDTGTLDQPMVRWRCKGKRRNPDCHSFCSTWHGRSTRDDVHRLDVSLHAQGIISACWTFGGRRELKELRRRPWAHVLGFRGHFSTKSRPDSTTLSCLGRPRREWRNNRLLVALGYAKQTRVRPNQDCDEDISEDDDAIFVIGQWRYCGRGHFPGEAIYARTIPEDLAENRTPMSPDEGNE